MPPKELLFVYPPDVPGPVSAEAAIIRELPSEDARIAVKAYRLLLLWAHPHEAGSPVFLMEDLQTLEVELGNTALERYRRDRTDVLGIPLAWMLSCVVTDGEVDSEEVARGCLTVMAWAGEREYVETGRAFVELAA